MRNDFDDTIYFRYCRAIDGRLESVDVARHNGRLVPRFDLSWTTYALPGNDQSISSDYVELVSEISTALTVRQRQIWRRRGQELNP